MPFYDYKCQACEHQFEALQKISDPLLTECPECHSDSLRKMVSAPAFRLSGSGWYETDFKSGNKKNIAGDSSDSGSSVSSSTNSSGDTRTSVKKDTSSSNSSTSKSSSTSAS